MTNERLPQQEEQDEEEQRMGWIRISALVIIVGSLAFIIYDACTANHLKQACVNFLTWVQHNPTLGVVAVIIVYAVGTSKLSRCAQENVFGTDDDNSLEKSSLCPRILADGRCRFRVRCGLSALQRVCF